VKVEIADIQAHESPPRIENALYVSMISRLTSKYKANSGTRH